MVHYGGYSLDFCLGELPFLRSEDNMISVQLKLCNVVIRTSIFEQGFDRSVSAKLLSEYHTVSHYILFKFTPLFNLFSFPGMIKLTLTDGIV